MTDAQIGIWNWGGGEGMFKGNISRLPGQSTGNNTRAISN